MTAYWHPADTEKLGTHLARDVARTKPRQQFAWHLPEQEETHMHRTPTTMDLAAFGAIVLDYLASATGTDRTTAAAAAFITARQLLAGTPHDVGDTLDRAVELIEQVAVVDEAERILSEAVEVDE